MLKEHGIPFESSSFIDMNFPTSLSVDDYILAMIGQNELSIDTYPNVCRDARCETHSNINVPGFQGTDGFIRHMSLQDFRNYLKALIPLS